MESFSSLYRSDFLSRLRSGSFDLLIIGGGITGAGVALDAASRGLKVALVEKNDFAFGTSSRSTKLIHGGLRYLKQLEFGLVKEVGSERAIVHNLAPHLVIPEKMLLPLSEKKGLGYWLTSIGLKIYDWLAGVKPEDQRKMLTRLQTLRAEPLLKKDDVKGGALYAEYRTDDARLTIEIIKKAAYYGATVLNYVRADNFIYNEGKISGVGIHDALGDERFNVRATVIVNAAGPWVDELRTLNNSLKGKRLNLTKGVHIVVAREKFPVKQAIYFDVDDGRMIFAIPRGRVTYIGTTDTHYRDDKNEVVVSAEDAAYLLKAVNATFPTASLQLDDIESGWAGLRPLIYEEGKSASELSRKDEIFESPTRLISIAGGKLTGYRKMAERVVDLVIKRNFNDHDLKPCSTEKIKLTEKSFADYREVKKYVAKLEEKLAAFHFLPETARYLVENYGRQSDSIIKDFEENYAETDNELGLLKAELKFTIHHEMVNTLADFFVRRTGLLYFNIDKVVRWKEAIADEMAILYNWDTPKRNSEIEHMNKLIAQTTVNYQPRMSE